MTELPRIFIGSSSEQIEIADTIQELLDLYSEPTVWSQGIFQPSRFALADLVQASRSFDFAAFVFAPDDLLLMRGHKLPFARDNVIFELGLFMGALEPTRCFIIAPRGSNLHLPTDLLGITPLTYQSTRSDRNLVAALGPACLNVRRVMRDLHARPKTVEVKAGSGAGAAPTRLLRSAEDFIAEWNGPELSAARNAIRELPFDPHDEEFQQKRPSLKQVFLFLDELAGSVLAGTIDERAAREHFEKAVVSVWAVAHTLLAPPNHADEWWDPPPKIARLSQRWRSGDR